MEFVAAIGLFIVAIAALGIMLVLIVKAFAISALAGLTATMIAGFVIFFVAAA